MRHILNDYVTSQSTCLHPRTDCLNYKYWFSINWWRRNISSPELFSPRNLWRGPCIRPEGFSRADWRRFPSACREFHRTRPSRGQKTESRSWSDAADLRSVFWAQTLKWNTRPTRANRPEVCPEERGPGRPDGPQASPVHEEETDPLFCLQSRTETSRPRYFRHLGHVDFATATPLYSSSRWVTQIKPFYFYDHFTINMAARQTLPEGTER